MSTTALADVKSHLEEHAAQLVSSGYCPGYVAGVYHKGELTVVGHGTRNIVTGDPMTEDTGFLMGSITKPFTATLLFQCVERGQIDLDERVVTYLPEFELAPPAKFEEIRVRNLLNGTTGIDGEFFWPFGVTGKGALAYYVQELKRCSTLFDPGDYVSYSSAALLVAGRILEVVTGETYHDLLERELFGPLEMNDSSTSPERAILRRTAVGHFLDQATGAVRRTDMFMLPETWSAAGATPIVTIADLLQFARLHLADGVAPNGARLLTADLTRQMRTVTVDMGVPNVTPIGLGWPFLPFGETTVITHGGASPGGAAGMLLVPEHDFAFAGFGNSGAADMTSDQLAMWLLREYLGLESPPVVTGEVEVADLRPYEGTYRSDQFRIDVRAVDGQLEETMTYEPLDADQERIFTDFSGGGFPYPPFRVVPVGEHLFAMAGMPLEMFNGLNRTRLISFHGWVDGRPTYHSFGGRMTRRAD
jgi:CubicO group peptidase (beta-lactamase class C family)